MPFQIHMISVDILLKNFNKSTCYLSYLDKKVSEECSIIRFVWGIRQLDLGKIMNIMNMYYKNCLNYYNTFSDGYYLMTIKELNCSDKMFFFKYHEINKISKDINRIRIFKRNQEENQRKRRIKKNKKKKKILSVLEQVD